MRWSLFLQNFDFKISYVTSDNNIADYFSRHINVLQEDKRQVEEKRYSKNIMSKGDMTLEVA